MTDDQPAWSVRWQPNLQRLMHDRGLNFGNACVADPLCAPNRTSVLLGRYSHNHGITDNADATVKFREAGYEIEHYGAALKDAGYRTGYFGKFLNNHPRNLVPNAWLRYYYLVESEVNDHKFYVNDQGTYKVIDRSIWDDTDLLAEKAANFVEASVRMQPWMCVVGLWAPHSPYGGEHIPPRHRHDYDDMPRPTGEQFSDSPEHYAPMDYTAAWSQNYHEGLREELQTVDDAVEKMIRRLAATGQLENTYIFYTTDNGFISGQHKLIQKVKHYDEAVRVPLVVRGPGIPAGVQIASLVSGVDFAPTFLELAKVPDTIPRDGRSFVPLLGGVEPADWRQSMLVEHTNAQHQWDMVRTKRYTYVEFTDGDKLLYDRKADPKMLHDSYNLADPTLLAELSSRLEILKGCSGDTCRTAENAP
jgi:N-acetylglucosamine-6-sulfatase